MVSADKPRVRRGVGILRNLLWAEGAFFCLGAPQILYYLVTHTQNLRSDNPDFLKLEAGIYAALGYVFLCGATAVLAAYGLEQNRWWTLRALAVSSFFNLPLVPVGTVAGAYGLYLAKNTPVSRSLLLELSVPMPVSSGSSTTEARERSRQELPGRVAVGLQVLISLFLVPLTAAYLQDHGSPVLGYWQFVASFLIAVLGGIFCHEMGHIIAGVLSGFQFQTLSVGPLVISLLSDGWRVQWVNSLGLWNGMTVMSPKNPSRLRSNAIFFVGGGPIASLLCGAVAISLFLDGPNLRLREAAEFFGILGVVELTACLVNLLPLRIPGGYTDGARILQLLAKKPEGEAFLAELAFGLSDTTTLRPKDWHPDWIRSVTADPKSPGFSHGCYQAYVHHLDRGEIDDASIWLARCMDSHNALSKDPYRWILAIENAFFEARHLHNVEDAQRWLTVPRAGIAVEKFTLLRVQAAVAVAQGERELARKSINAALRLHAESIETGRQQFERAVLRDVQNWFDEINGSAGLSRLAQSLRERELVEDAARTLQQQRSSPIRALQDMLKR